jgi:branched-chain amino acid transport system permease protein
MISTVIAYVSRGYKELRGEIFVLPSRTVVVIFCLMLFLVPVITGNPHYLSILTLTCIFAIFAASWDLLSGFTGQMNFGHATFFGVAAYTAALLNVYIGLPPWLTIPIGAIAAVLVSLILGVPCLRLRGIYLAFGTLAFPLIIKDIIPAIPGAGGTLGVQGIKAIVPISSSPVIEYYIAAALMVVLGFIMWKITDSKTGLIFHAIREDEVTVRASGINTTRYKLLAFCLSGFFAGIAGGLYVHLIGVASPDAVFTLTLSFQAIIWAVFGGIATIYGAIAGVFILYSLYSLPEYLSFNISELRMLLVAVIVLLVLFFMPEGLITWIRDKTEKTCPRCKLQNVAWRKTCRVCRVELD